jgi:ATP-dependent Lon protease
MIHGIPIIYQGVVRNPKNIVQNGDEKTFGSVDLLVRSDWINKIVEKSSIDDINILIPAPKIKKEYHYCVVDIKWTKLHFNTNKETLRNDPHVKPFKTQLAVYNEALGYMQGYTPKSAYILGNGWICEKSRMRKKIVTKSNNPFDRLARIDFTTFDKDYTEKASDAIIWLRKLKKQNNFTHDPPNILELYPNMNNTMDGKYHHVKEQISEKYHEITQIWNCGIKEREMAFDNGVKSWNNKKFNANLIGLRDGKKKKIIDSIVTMNRDRNDLIYPNIIKNNVDDWQNVNITAFYVDFETIQENLINETKIIGDYIFMIGIGYIRNNKFEYKNLTSIDISIQSEKNIIDNFLKFIKNETKTKNNILFHWGQHERNIFTRAIERHGNIWTMPNFVDFCKIMTNEPILIRGAYNFGLKTIAKAMYKNNMIKTIWNDDMKDGASAMFLGWKEYKKCPKDIENTEMMKKIIEYNKIDCQTVYEIIDYLRHKGILTKNNMMTDNQQNNGECDENNWKKRLRSSKKTDENEKSSKRQKMSNEETFNKNQYIDVDQVDTLINQITTEYNDDIKNKTLNYEEETEEEIEEETEEESDDEESDDEESDDEESYSDESYKKQKSDDEMEDKYDSDFVVDDISNVNEQNENNNILESLIHDYFKIAKEKCNNKEYLDKLEKIMMDRMVDIKDIHELKISDEEKADLIEKYLSNITNMNIEEFIEERGKLKKTICNLQKQDINEKKKYDEIKDNLDKIHNCNMSLEKKILDLDIDNFGKKIIYEKFKQLEILGKRTDTRAKLQEWINHAIRIPYNVIKTIDLEGKTIGEYLSHVKQKLDDSLYGMNKAKEELLMILNNKLRNPESFKNTLAFVGSPGTGKTALIIALCDALKLPYYQISLGGKHDASFFLGHSYTYEGSQPGQIVSALQKMQCKNGILFFDEFDKIGAHDGKKGVSDLLLHITDFTQNNKFNDEYIADVSIDLSKIWFMFSLNKIENVDPILRNRMTFINVPSYNDDEKKIIVKNYIIPKCIKQFTFNSNDIIISDDIISYIITKTESEEGVRENERTIIEIFKRLNILRTIYDNKTEPTIKMSFDIPEFKLPLVLTKKHIDILMITQKKNDIMDNMLYM